MTFKLNDLKRTLAESTYKQQPKYKRSSFNAKKMIEESKATLRSTEPYIGGEKETGERIHRYRDKSRELMNITHHHRSAQEKIESKDILNT